MLKFLVLYVMAAIEIPKIATKNFANRLGLFGKLGHLVQHSAKKIKEPKKEYEIAVAHLVSAIFIIIFIALMEIRLKKLRAMDQTSVVLGNNGVNGTLKIVSVWMKRIS